MKGARDKMEVGFLETAGRDSHSLPPPPGLTGEDTFDYRKGRRVWGQVSSRTYKEFLISVPKSVNND